MSTLLLIVLSLLLVAFFSGIEIAFFQANKLRVELKSKQGNLNARLITKFIKYPSRFIGVILIGLNITIVVYGSLMAEILQPYIQQKFNISPENETLIILIETIISTAVVLMLGEFFPKIIFRIKADQMLLLCAIPLNIAYVLFFPIVWVIVKISEWILAVILKIPIENNTQVFRKIDLDHFIRESGRSNTTVEMPVDIDYFQNALQFDQVKIRECMIPRMEIVSVSVDADIEEIRKTFVQSEHSRIIVYEGDIENSIGFIHYSWLLNPSGTIRDAVIPLIIVPESFPAIQLFNRFTQERKSIALVVDEFGGTSGIVTLEDLLEEIFGEISDEHDTEDQTERVLKENTWIFSARLEIDYLNKKYHLDLPEGDYETLGGLLIEHFGSIPEVNSKISLDRLNFTILTVSDTRIQNVKLELVSSEL